MAAQVKSFDLDSHSKTVSKNTSPHKMQNMPSERGQELLKALIRKRTTDKGNVVESKPFTDSKKTCISAHNQWNKGGKELLKAVRKETEKLDIKEDKSKSGTHPKKTCFCSPTTHEGSFRCHLHRISASKKSTNEKNCNLMLKSKRTHGTVEFNPQSTRFSRIASAEVGPHESLIQLSGLESS